MINVTIRVLDPYNGWIHNKDTRAITDSLDTEDFVLRNGVQCLENAVQGQWGHWMIISSIVPNRATLNFKLLTADRVIYLIRLLQEWWLYK